MSNAEVAQQRVDVRGREGTRRQLCQDGLAGQRSKLLEKLELPLARDVAEVGLELLQVRDQVPAAVHLRAQPDEDPGQIVVPEAREQARDVRKQKLLDPVEPVAAFLLTPALREPAAESGRPAGGRVLHVDHDERRGGGVEHEAQRVLEDRVAAQRKYRISTRTREALDALGDIGDRSRQRAGAPEGAEPEERRLLRCNW